MYRMHLTYSKCLGNSSRDFHPPGPLPGSLGSGRGPGLLPGPQRSWGNLDDNSPNPSAMSQVLTQVHLHCPGNETFPPTTESQTQTNFFRLKQTNKKNTGESTKMLWQATAAHLGYQSVPATSQIGSKCRPPALQIVEQVGHRGELLVKPVWLS